MGVKRWARMRLGNAMGDRVGPWPVRGARRPGRKAATSGCAPRTFHGLCRFGARGFVAYCGRWSTDDATAPSPLSRLRAARSRERGGVSILRWGARCGAPREPGPCRACGAPFAGGALRRRHGRGGAWVRRRRRVHEIHERDRATLRCRCLRPDAIRAARRRRDRRCHSRRGRRGRDGLRGGRALQEIAPRRRRKLRLVSPDRLNGGDLNVTFRSCVLGKLH
jgi:hypothetical protein